MSSKGKKPRNPQHKAQAKKKLSNLKMKTINSTKGNLYLKSLLYPEEDYGAKIPDFEMYPSSTFQVQQDLILTTNAVGDQSIVIAPGFYQNVQTNSGVTTVWTFATGAWANLTAYAAIQNNYTRYRPVSAAIVAEFIGSTANDQGECAVWLMPTNAAFIIGAGSFQTLAAQMDCETFPLRNGFRAIWSPSQPQDFNYNNTGSAAGTGTNNYFSITWPTWQVGVTGAAVGPVLRIRLYFNFEAIPGVTGLDLIQPMPSPVKPNELAQACNVMSNIPTAHAFDKVAGYAKAALDAIVSDSGSGGGHQASNSPESNLFSLAAKYGPGIMEGLMTLL